MIITDKYETVKKRERSHRDCYSVHKLPNLFLFKTYSVFRDITNEWKGFHYDSLLIFVMLDWRDRRKMKVSIGDSVCFPFLLDIIKRCLLPWMKWRKLFYAVHLAFIWCYKFLVGAICPHRKQIFHTFFIFSSLNFFFLKEWEHYWDMFRRWWESKEHELQWSFLWRSAGPVWIST